jgi:hypothetical protein
MSAIEELRRQSSEARSAKIAFFSLLVWPLLLAVKARPRVNQFRGLARPG